MLDTWFSQSPGIKYQASCIQKPASSINHSKTKCKTTEEKSINIFITTLGIILETIAVYWEPRIKTYGLKEVLGLTMIKLEVKTIRLGKWGHLIGETGDRELSFELVLLQYKNAEELRLNLLFKASQEKEIIPHMNNFIDQNKGETLEILSPVEMVYFFGPHFGDRYGIAEAAVSALDGESLSVLAMGCSVSFIYIVLQEGTALQAKNLLAKNFEIP